MSTRHVEVHDDGRGIPTDKEPKTGLAGCRGGGDQAPCRRKVRRRLVRRHRRSARRRAASVVNALSARMDIDVDRRRRQQGDVVPARRARRLRRRRARTAPFTPKSGLTQGQAGREGQDWHPDPVLARPPDLHQGRRVRVRGAGRPGPSDVVHRARASSWSSATCAATEPGRGEVPPRRRHRGVLRVPAHDEPVTEVLRLQGSDTFTETVPMLDDQGHMTPQDVERELERRRRVRWGTGYDTELRSFVNVIATPKGGTHVGRVRGRADQDVQRRDAGDARCSRSTTTTSIKDDVLEGITAVVTVRLAEPSSRARPRRSSARRPRAPSSARSSRRSSRSS